MSAVRARLAEPLLQLLAVAAIAAIGYGGWLGIGAPAMVVLAVVWPPRVPWLPLSAARVLAAYLPFAIGWLGFVVAYLHGLHALGVTVMPQPMLQQLADHGRGLEGFWATVFGIVVLAPLLEEVVFRGYLWTALELVLPRPAVQVATAAAFGLVHGAHYALPIGVLALVFGWLRARHGSLLPSVLAHAVHNGLTVVVTLAWPGHLELLYPR